jgi:hypothetical protein
VIDDAFVGRRSPDQGDIVLLHATGLERASEGRRRLACPRKEERAARAAVEAVHGIDLCAEHVAHPEERHVVVRGPSAMDQQARRLVRDDDRVVDEDKLDRGRRGQAEAC